MVAIIKRVKEYGSNVLIASQEFREYVEKQETEINRGISSLCILSIIMQSEEKELHGYKILKDLTHQTNEMLVIEEGTLYPILRKLEEEKIIKSLKRLNRSFPEMLLHTHIMIGFPTETEEEFYQTLTFIKDCNFDGGKAFPYSCKSGSIAESIEPKIPKDEINK